MVLFNRMIGDDVDTVEDVTLGFTLGDLVEARNVLESLVERDLDANTTCLSAAEFGAVLDANAVLRRLVYALEGR